MVANSGGYLMLLHLRLCVRSYACNDDCVYVCECILLYDFFPFIYMSCTGTSASTCFLSSALVAASDFTTAKAFNCSALEGGGGGGARGKGMGKGGKEEGR